MFRICSFMPYERVILGPKYAIRLENLTAADVFVVTCLSCGRVWRVAPHRLYTLFEPDLPLIWAERRLRCRRCGVRGEALGWHIERARLDDPHASPSLGRRAPGG